MLEGKKVIIFDLDGTLIDSIGIWNEIDETLIKKIANVNIDMENVAIQRANVLKQYSKYADPYLEYCGYLKEKYNCTYAKEEIQNIRYDIAENYLRENVCYKPNAEEALKYLKSKNFTLVLASITGIHTVDIYRKYNKNIINKANFDDIFSKIYTKESVSKLKPNSEVYEKILKEFEVEASECLIFEDSLTGVEAANSANIEVAVMYDKYSDKNRSKINELSQYRFSNYAEMLDCIKKEMES